MTDASVSPVLALALVLLHGGVSFLPVEADGSKRPALNERGAPMAWTRYQSHLPTEAEARTWFADGRRGIAAIGGAISGNLECLDFDDGPIFQEYLKLAKKQDLTDLLKTLILVHTPSGGFHLWYRCAGSVDGNQKLARRQVTLEDGTQEVQVLIETRGEKGYAILPPSPASCHAENRPYALVRNSFNSIPVVTPDQRETLLDLARSFNEYVREAPAPILIHSGRSNGLKPGEDYDQRGDVAGLLRQHGWTHVGGEYWRRPGKKQGVSATLGHIAPNVLHVFTSSTPFDPDRTYTPFATYTTLEHAGDFKSAAKALAHEGYGTSSPGTNGHRLHDEDTPSEIAFAPQELIGDTANAQRLVRLYGSQLRYCGRWRQWLIWDGRRWIEDVKDRAVTEFAKATVKSIYAEAGEAADKADRERLAKWALASESKRRIRDMVDLAASIPGIPVDPTAFDADPHLFNCLNGTLDLETGELRPHDPSNLLMKLAPVAYDPDATAPRWLSFLDRIMKGNANLIAFLARAVGYSIGGDTGEEVFFLLHGSGRNGKSKFLLAIKDMMGDYARAAGPETFIEKNQDRRRDLADLVGARFVPTIETGEGHRLAENLIKWATGKDPIKAARLYQDQFEYIPVFKIWMACNRKPVIKGTDEGIWERIKVIPFTVKIPKDERDPELDLKLRAELPGILNWAMTGRADWRRQRLGDPAEVEQALMSYREEEDSLGQFVADRCWEAPEAHIQSTALCKAYEAWARDNGERPLSMKVLAPRLRERSYEDRRTGTGIVWHGVGLLAAYTTETDGGNAWSGS